MANYVVWMSRTKHGMRTFKSKTKAKKYAITKRKQGYAVSNRSISLRTLKKIRRR